MRSLHGGASWLSCLAVLSVFLGAQASSVSDSGSGSGSASFAGGCSCHGAVWYEEGERLVSLDPAMSFAAWPTLAGADMCPMPEMGSTSSMGTGMSVGSSIAGGECRCVVFVIPPMDGPKGSGSMSGSGGDEVNYAGGCYDPSADWAQRNGITCEEPGLGFALDGSFAYVCCTGEMCNDQALLMANVEAINAYISPDCTSPLAVECVQTYAESYGCLVDSVILPSPHQPHPDECAPFVRPTLGCLAAYCARGCRCDLPEDMMGPGCEEYCEAFEDEFPAPGCTPDRIADHFCDPLCLTEDALFDGGDCLKLPYTRTAISTILIAHDKDGSGTLSMRELEDVEGLCGYVNHDMFAMMDVKGDDGLDVQELYLMMIANHPNKDGSCLGFLSMEERAAVAPYYEPETETHWVKTTWAYSVPLYLFADANQDAIISPDEAMMAFGLDEHEMKFLAAGDEEAAFNHVDEIFSAVLAALMGDFWGDMNYDMDAAVHVFLKFADYSRDGMVSMGEAMYVGIGKHAFMQLDVDDDRMLSFDEFIAVVRGIAMGPCNGFRVVDEIDGDIMAQLPIIRPSTCKLAVMPSWNYAREMEPIMEPRCNATNFDERNYPSEIRSHFKKGLLKSTAELMQTRRTALHRQFVADKKTAKKHTHKIKSRSAHARAQQPEGPVRPRRSLSPAHKKLKVERAQSVRLASLHSKPVHPRKATIARQTGAADREEHLRVVGGTRANPLEFPFVVSIHSTQTGASGSGSMSGSMSSSGSMGGFRPVPRSHDGDGAYCTGTLIAPEWVMTAAHCVYGMEKQVIDWDMVTIGIDDAVEEAADRGCMESFSIVEVLLHPGFDLVTFGNDVALLKLDGASSYPPVELYDGGDLMFNECKKLQPLAVAWSAQEPRGLQYVQLEPMAPWECRDMWFTVSGNPELLDAATMMCMVGDGVATCPGDSGGPLLAPHPESKSGWVQIGINSWGLDRCQPGFPEVYTRVSEVLQWVLSVPALGVHPARSLRLTLDAVSIPMGTTVDVWKGAAEAVTMGDSPKLLDSLDSKCDAGETYSDEGEGCLLLVMRTASPFDARGFLCEHFPGSDGCYYAEPLGIPEGGVEMDDEECDLDCTMGLGVRASLQSLGCAENYMPPKDYDDRATKAAYCEDPWASGELGANEGSVGIEGCVLKRNKEEEESDMYEDRVFECVPRRTCGLRDMSWEKITAMARMGKAVTGGLGISAERTHDYDFRTYVCVRDWDVEEQLLCNVKPKEFACFKFDENHREFHWFGLNSELKVIKEETLMEAYAMERKMIAALPPLPED